MSSPDATGSSGGIGPHRSIRLVESACTSCMLCARECPSWCISIDSHAESVSDQPGARPRTVHVLDRFDLDWSLCMFCGICIEVCPFDALEWSDQQLAPAETLASMAAKIAELR